MRFASLADRAQPAVGGFGGKVLGRRSPEQARIGAAITRKWTRICNHEGPLPMSDKGTATDASRHKDPVGLCLPSRSGSLATLAGDAPGLVAGEQLGCRPAFSGAL